MSVTAAPTGQQVTGAFASACFEVQTATVRLPPLALVDPALTVRTQGTAVVSSWSTQRPGPYALSFEAGGTVPIWTTVATGGRTGLDGRVLEGTAGRAVLSATSTDTVEGSDAALTWRTPGQANASDTAAPDSRGASCTYGDAAPRPAA